LKVVVGIPAYNEEKNIGSIIAKLQKIADKIIVCDDCSTDSTGIIAEKLGAVVIHHERNRGYGAAIRSIFLKAKEMDLDVLVTFDADGQHRPEDIPNVIKPVRENQADLVIGSRFLDKEWDTVPAYRKLGIKTITGLTNRSLTEKITDSQSGFRAYNRKVIQDVNPSDLGMGISTELLIKANKQGFRIAEVPIKALYGGDTSTHNPVSHGASVALSTIKYISIENPLKFYAVPGIIFLVVGLFFIVWTIQAFGETGIIITNISLIGIGFTILGFMLLNTSIILYSIISVVRERS